MSALAHKKDLGLPYSLTVAFYYGADEVGNIIFEDDDKFTTESVLMLNQGIRLTREDK